MWIHCPYSTHKTRAQFRSVVRSVIEVHIVVFSCYLVPHLFSSVTSVCNCFTVSFRYKVVF